MVFESEIGVGADLTIQIVNFKSRHYLEKCLFSISENLPEGIRAEIVIVNNDEMPLPEIQSRFDSRLDLRLIEINKNIGFGAAHNAGAKRALGEYILFLNPDTEIRPNALGNLFNILAEDKNIGIVGSLLTDEQGQIQPNCFGAARTPLSTIGGKIFAKEDIIKKNNEEIFETDWVSGGAMMTPKNVFEEIGGFDENYFMYFEDVDLCLRVKQAGYKVAICPSAHIFHESGKSFESEGEKKRLYYASQDYYLKKHFGRAAAEFVRLLRLPYFIRNVWLR